MALIHCPECNNNVSTSAKFCPHCGYPVQEFLQETSLANTHDNRIEFDLTDSDSDETINHTTNINGIDVDLGKLIEYNEFNSNNSIKALNSITKIGMVKSKIIIDDFLFNNPEFDKENIEKEYIKYQVNLNKIFKCDLKLGKLSFDTKNKLFKNGFWSYIYKFDEIQRIYIDNSDNSKVSLIIDIDHATNTIIKINMPTMKNIKDIKDLKNIKNIKDLNIKNMVISREDSLVKASEIKEKILNIISD